MHMQKPIVSFGEPPVCTQTVEPQNMKLAVKNDGSANVTLSVLLEDRITFVPLIGDTIELSIEDRCVFQGEIASFEVDGNWLTVSATGKQP